jgi:hypothetical protein
MACKPLAHDPATCRCTGQNRGTDGSIITANARPRLNGRVVGSHPRFYVVETDHPGHLGVLSLEPRVMDGARIGDEVVLEYYASNSCGEWRVVAKTCADCGGRHDLD